MRFERLIWASLLCGAFGFSASESAFVRPELPQTDLPQIPFDVVYDAYGKTVEVVGSCAKRKDSITLRFNPSDHNIGATVYAAVNRAFDMPGITRVQVCRKSK